MGLRIYRVQGLGLRVMGSDESCSCTFWFGSMQTTSRNTLCSPTNMMISPKSFVSHRGLNSYKRVSGYTDRSTADPSKSFLWGIMARVDVQTPSPTGIRDVVSV